MYLNMDYELYNGVFVLEGHTLAYEFHGDTCTIRETIHHQSREPHNSHTRVSSSNAVIHQNKFIKLGYDKVS
tara:strand:+ start:225 stop:440 length:216 start_codon:yes stop_codon:yes gene_type:complete